MTDPKQGSPRRGNAGMGRRPGSKNKLTQSAKEAFQYAFDRLGGGVALAAWATENQTEFYKLFARLIPIEQQHTGKNGESLKVVVEFVGRNSPVP